MQWARVAFALMLMLTLVPALSVTPSNVLGQGYVTSTTQITTTGLYTSAATTEYQATVLTTTNTYFSGIVIPALNPGTNPACGWKWKSFTAKRGESVYISLTSKTPVTFYVMSYAVRDSWTVDGHPVDTGSPDSYSPCHGAPDGSLIVEDGIVNYSYNLVFPADGNYWLLFIQLGSPLEIPIDFEMISSPFVTTSTISSTSYASGPTTQLLAITTVVTTIVSQFDLPALLFGNIGLIGLVVIVVVIVSVAVVLLHRRRKVGSDSATRVYDQAVTVPVSRIETDEGALETTRSSARAEAKEADEHLSSFGERSEEKAPSVIYCHECGAENTTDNKFCKKCATRIDSPSK